MLVPYELRLQSWRCSRETFLELHVEPACLHQPVELLSFHGLRESISSDHGFGRDPADLRCGLGRHGVRVGGIPRAPDLLTEIGQVDGQALFADFSTCGVGNGRSGFGSR